MRLTEKIFTGSDGRVWQCYPHPSGAEIWHCPALYGVEVASCASLQFPAASTDDSGIAHATEHMVLRGCVRYPDPLFFWQLTSRLTMLECNASTQPDGTHFHLASLFESDALEALGYFLHATLAPLLRVTDFEQEVHNRSKEHGRGGKGVLVTEMQGYLGQPLFTRNLALASARPQRLPFYGGLPETIFELTAGDVRHYHKRHYHPAKLRLVLGGVWDIEKVVGLLDQAVSDWEESLSREVAAPAVCWVANPQRLNTIQTLIVSGIPDALWLGVRTLLQTHSGMIKKAGWALLPPLEDDHFSRAVAKGKSLRILQFERLDHGNPKTDLSGLVESLLYELKPGDVTAAVRARQLERHGEQAAKYGEHLAALYQAFALARAEPDTLPPMPDSNIAVSPFVSGPNRILQPGDYHRLRDGPVNLTTLGMCIRFPGRNYASARQALCFLRYFEQRSEDMFSSQGKPGRFSVSFHNGVTGVMALRAEVMKEDEAHCRDIWQSLLDETIEPVRCSSKLYSHWHQSSGIQKVLRETVNGLGEWHHAGEIIHAPQHFVQIWPPESISLRSWLAGKGEEEPSAGVAVSFSSGFNSESSPDSRPGVDETAQCLLLRGNVRCFSDPGACVVSVCLPETVLQPLSLGVLAHVVLAHPSLRQSRLAGNVYALGVDIDFALCRLSWYSYFDVSPEETAECILRAIDEVSDGRVSLKMHELHRAAQGEWHRRYCKSAAEYHAHINRLQGLVTEVERQPSLSVEALKSLSAKAQLALSHVP